MFEGWRINNAFFNFKFGHWTTLNGSRSKLSIIFLKQDDHDLKAKSNSFLVSSRLFLATVSERWWFDTRLSRPEPTASLVISLDQRLATSGYDDLLKSNFVLSETKPRKVWHSQWHRILRDLIASKTNELDLSRHSTEWLTDWSDRSRHRIDLQRQKCHYEETKFIHIHLL